jgi:nucleoside-diphosphate-sugar epimerase
MRILVTGSSGLVGRYVADDLAKAHEVILLDIKPSHRRDLPYRRMDVLDADGMLQTVKDVEIVVHLAGIPHPLNDPPSRVFTVNAVGTFNALEACWRNGIRRFILISSESTLGFAFSTNRLWPLYVPIDEHHPLRPEDPYGTSKLACEMLCQSYTRKGGIQTICLRPPWVWVPERAEQTRYRLLIQEYSNWHKNLWAFIDVRDLVSAVRLCVDSLSLPEHDAYFVCADENWTGRESRSLIAEYFPETKHIAEEFGGAMSLLSNLKAKRAFGFQPRFKATDVFSD